MATLSGAITGAAPAATLTAIKGGTFRIVYGGINAARLRVIWIARSVGTRLGVR